MSMDKSKCVGCRDNFYNGNNSIGVKECWMLKTAKIVSRFIIHINTPMNQKSGYIPVKRPNCYHEDGYVNIDKIPDYAK